MFRSLSLLLLMVLVCSPSDAQEPEFNGRTLSEWQTILREDPVPRKRRAAVVALGEIGAMSKDSLPQVLLQIGKALRSDSVAIVRLQAASLLAQQKVDENLLATLPDLVESVRVERDEKVQERVATILGRFGPLARTAVAPLIPNLQAKDATVRAATADALGRIGPDAKSAGPELLGLINEKDKTVRQAVVFALGRINPEEPEKVATALLAKVQDDAEQSIRQEAMVSLGFLGYRSPEIVKGIASRLQEKEADFRVVACLTLTKFRDSLNVVEAELTRVFQSDPDKSVRQNLVHLLPRAAGTDRSAVVKVLAEQLRQDQDFEVRIAIADELGSLGSVAKAAIPALRGAQRDSQIKVREAASRAIKAIEAPPPPPKP